MSSDPILVAEEFAGVLESLGIPYLIGGSVASTLHGEPRATIDVDFAVHLSEALTEALCDALEPDYYVDRVDARAAAQRGGFFNVLRLPTMVKVDVYARPREGIHAAEIERAEPRRLDPSSSRLVRVATAEDTLIQKLSWYRSGGEVADRQWRDVMGIVKQQADALDWAYVEHWAVPLGLEDLVARLQTDGERPAP